MTTMTATAATAIKFNRTALVILEDAVNDEANATPADERTWLKTKGHQGAAAKLVAAGLGKLVEGEYEKVRFFVSAEGVRYYQENRAKIQGATDILNARGATVHY